MATLYLVRHTSVDAITGLCYGQTEMPLAATFEEEAKSVAEKLGATSYDLVFCSPLSRCLRLAEFCGYNPTIDDRLLEVNFGRWENRLWDSITEPWLNQWFEQWATLRVPQGESFADVEYRAKSFIQMARATGANNILAFTHAGFIRALQVYLGIYTVEDVFSHKIGYGQIIKVNI